MKKNSVVIADIVRRVQITPEKKILLNGKPATPEFQNAYTSVPSNKMLFDMLQGVLYSHFYSNSNSLAAAQTNEQWFSETLAFTDTLATANRSEERFDRGWAIQHIDMAGQITARKGNLVRILHPGEFLNDSGFGHKPVAGESVRIYCRKEHREPGTGFYYVFGNHPGEDNHTQLVRLYFNIKPEGAALLVQEISTQLNQYQLPFSFKCLNHPAWYTRRDSAVLYVEKRYSDMVFQLVTGIYNRLKKYMEPSVPLFSKKLARGLAFAENPLNEQESFGTHCCKMITQGMMAAFNKKIPHDKWVNEIKYAIEQVHHYPNWEQLYLNPGSVYPYRFPKFNEHT